MSSRCCQAAVAAAVLFVSTVSALAENRYVAPDAELLAGATGAEIALTCDHDVAILGYSFGITYDPEKIAVTDVTAVGTIGENADFFEGRIVSEDGLIGYGCVFSFEGIADSALPAAAGEVMAIIQLDVVADSATTATIAFESVQIDPEPLPPTKNIMTDDSATSVVPTLVEGTISILARTPVVTGIVDGEGEPGQVFQIEGEYLDEPGLVVTLCGKEAETNVISAGLIDVTAPECTEIACLDIELCTDRGCVTEVGGFCYTDDPAPTLFVRGDADGSLGLDLTDGIRILNFLFLGGPASECQDSMDSNDSGGIDLTDGIYVFNHLFLGGPQPAPPYPEPGEDPTDDDLPGC